MSPREPSALHCYEDPDLFREAVSYTVTRTGFSARLIEKDYFASVLLEHLSSEDVPLVFKGGTCLAKVHTGFYRLSEDLDFVISMPADAPRRQRSEHGRHVMKVVAALPTAMTCFRIVEPVKGANLSTHYTGVVGFTSLLSATEELIRIEVDLRECLLTPCAEYQANSILMDPVSGGPMVAPLSVWCMSRIEAFAEKFRAALTRREPAIRDFFDIDYAVRVLGLRPSDAELVDLVKRKLAVSGNPAPDLSTTRLASLRRQVEAQLRPVLRQADFKQFDLDRAYHAVAEMGRLAEQL